MAKAKKNRKGPARAQAKAAVRKSKTSASATARPTPEKKTSARPTPKKKTQKVSAEAKSTILKKPYSGPKTSGGLSGLVMKLAGIAGGGAAGGAMASLVRKKFVEPRVAELRAGRVAGMQTTDTQEAAVRKVEFMGHAVNVGLAALVIGAGQTRRIPMLVDVGSGMAAGYAAKLTEGAVTASLDKASRQDDRAPPTVGAARAPRYLPPPRQVLPMSYGGGAPAQVGAPVVLAQAVEQNNLVL